MLGPPCQDVLRALCPLLLDQPLCFALVEERAEMPAEIAERLRIPQQRGGIAAVPVKKGACGGCFRQLSPQLLVEARRTDKLLRCENCGRMLIWKDEGLV